jgi:hypothetical protein
VNVSVDMQDDESVVAVCRRGKAKQQVSILKLLFSSPLAGNTWIKAYRTGLNGGW